MLFDHPDYDDHHGVHYLSDPAAGLRAVVALHRVQSGFPAVGGIRFRPYPDDVAALTDALRLSSAMTLKTVLAGLPAGGGKTVIIGDPHTRKTPALLRALGREIEAFGGRYLGGPDVGTSPRDMDVIREVTTRVGGTTSSMGPGGSAPPTAEGVFHAVRALAAFLNGVPDLDGLTVAVQGVGAVGADLCERLAREGVRLTIADVDPVATDRVAAATGAQVVSVGDVLSTPADILAPCALGAVLSPTTIPHLAVRGICGAANNQLAGDNDGARLHARGIAYVPDYVSSAGGVIAGVAAEGLIDKAKARDLIAGIFDRTLAILTTASDSSTEPALVAKQMAREGLAARA